MTIRSKLTEEEVQLTAELVRQHGPAEAGRRLGISTNAVCLRMRTLRRQQEKDRVRPVTDQVFPTPLHTLTAAERRVLIYMLDGVPNKNMAAWMPCSLRTIETHRAAIFQKTGAGGVAELVHYVHWLLYGRAYSSGDLLAFISSSGTAPLAEASREVAG